MKITRLAKARGYRIFRNFSWPTDLPDFARFNVIYGWNGSGKTSLSNLFRHIQRRESLTEGQVEVLVNQARVAGANFDTAVLPPVRVFNRDTVRRNVFELASEQLPPVFFLGEDSVEKQQQIEQLKKRLDATLLDLSAWGRKKAEASTAFESFCTAQGKSIKNLLTVAGGGPFNNYNAANFKADAQRLSKTPPAPLTKDDRQRYLTIKDGKPMERVVPLQASFPDFLGLMARTQALLEHSVVSAVIIELAENPAISTWVSEGLALHTGELASDRCRFCDQPLPSQRVRQLDAHFNDQFKRFQADVDALMGDITSAHDFPQTLQIPPKEALYENLRAEYEQSRQALTLHTQTVQQALLVLLRALKAKRDEPFKRFELRSFITNLDPPSETASRLETFFQIAAAGLAAVSTAMGTTAFARLKALIDHHNTHTEGFDASVKAARIALAENEVLKALPGWKQKSGAVAEAQLSESTAQLEATKLREQIGALETQVRQHRRPAEELTDEIKAYLGRDELRFEVEQNGYRIMRGLAPATHLSEGERTAIAFLYFLKSLQGTDFDLNTGVVVIDDPVSSLDANSLFSAFGFMKQRAASAGQLFVLTHNFAFFRQVRNWYYNLPHQRKKDPALQPARFYMLVPEFRDGERTATLQALDPFLYQYESEYHYLFKRVHEEAGKPALLGLETYYAMPNIARRLLESFLAFRVPDKPGELFQKLEGVTYDTAKKTRILRFLHTYSHFDQVAEPDHDASVLSETPAVLRDVLDLIRSCDPEHFRSMCDLVAPATTPIAPEATA